MKRYFHSMKRYFHSMKRYFHSMKRCFHSMKRYFHSMKRYFHSMKRYFHSMTRLLFLMVNWVTTLPQYNLYPLFKKYTQEFVITINNNEFIHYGKNSQNINYLLMAKNQCRIKENFIGYINKNYKERLMENDTIYPFHLEDDNNHYCIHYSRTYYNKKGNIEKINFYFFQNKMVIYAMENIEGINNININLTNEILNNCLEYSSIPLKNFIEILQKNHQLKTGISNSITYFYWDYEDDYGQDLNKIFNEFQLLMDIHHRHNLAYYFRGPSLKYESNSYSLDFININKYAIATYVYNTEYYQILFYNNYCCIFYLAPEMNSELGEISINKSHFENLLELLKKNSPPLLYDFIKQIFPTMKLDYNSDNYGFLIYYYTQEDENILHNLFKNFQDKLDNKPSKK